MDFLKIAWHYVIIVWPYAVMLCGTFAGIYFGAKMGYKWGKKDSSEWLKLKINAAVETRLSHPLKFLNAPDWDRKEEKRVPGVLLLNYAGLKEIELGLPVSFKFIPDSR